MTMEGVHNRNVEFERSDERPGFESVGVDEIWSVKPDRCAQLVACAHIIEWVDATPEVLYPPDSEMIDYRVLHFGTLDLTRHKQHVEPLLGECLRNSPYIPRGAAHVHSSNDLHHSHECSPIRVIEPVDHPLSGKQDPFGTGVAETIDLQIRCTVSRLP